MTEPVTVPAVLLPSGWDATADAFSKYITFSNNGGSGFTTLYAIDAFNLTIPKEDKEKTMTILDIACGTGPLSIYGITEFPNSKFIATDFSPSMIAITERLIKENDLGKRIEAKVMDGMNLSPIESNSINYTYSIFGLIFFPSVIQGMKEMNRVLVSGGKTAIASWCNDAFLISSFQETMDELLTIQNNGIPTKYEQVASSLSDENVFIDSLKSAGFIDCKVVKVAHQMEVNELTDILNNFATNPAYIDCIDNLKSEELKSKFNPTWLKVANSKNPQRNPTTNKLQLNSTSFIGVGTKK